MTNIEKIRQEIERRKQSLRAGICNPDAFTRKQKLEMLVASEELDRLNRFLDTLTEEPDKSLEEAATISLDEAKSLPNEYVDYLAKGLTENRPRPIGPHWFCEYAKNRFIAGAEWAFRQGWTFDAHKGAFGICFDGNIDNLLDSLKDKEEVTVQIRKK